MTRSSSKARVLGRHLGGRPGPTIVTFGAIHGNEPAGVAAIERVFARIEQEKLPVGGRLVGLAGNLRALGERRRFVDRDLNRRWTAEHIARLVNTGGDEASEDGETLELLREVVPLLRAADGPVVFLDLHSTSGPARPFSCMADVIRNRRIALALPIPVVLGLEEVIDESMLGYFCDLGHVGVAVEGGQHDDPATVDGLESALLLTLVAAGALAPDELRDMSLHRARLLARAAGLPSVCEIRHRHVVTAADEPFTMAPGWENFQPVRKGQVVARDRHGSVRSPYDGLMMLPRYQGQGEDGFFVAGVVSRMALTTSAVLRSLQLDRLIPYLPGVSRHPEREDHYIANPQVARVGVAQVFHLFGYRHVRPHAQSLVFSRRSPAQGKTPRLPSELMPLALRADEG